MLDVGGGTIRKGDSLQADGVHALHLIAIWEEETSVNTAHPIKTQLFSVLFTQSFQHTQASLTLEFWTVD